MNSNEYPQSPDLVFQFPAFNSDWLTLYGNGKMRNFGSEIYFAVDDTIFVYDANTTSGSNIKRKILLPATEVGIADMELVGNTLYATANSKDLLTIDLTGIDSSIYDTTLFVASITVGNMSLDNHNDLEFHNGYLFASSNNGVDILDVSDPANPQMKFSIGNGDLNEFIIRGNTMYYKGSTINGENIQIYDVTNPVEPNLLSAIAYTGNLMALNKSGDKLYLQTAEKIREFDVSDINDIKKTNVYSINGLFYNDQVGHMIIDDKKITLVSGSIASKGIIVMGIKD